MPEPTAIEQIVRERQGEMSLGDHLEELRSRLVLAVFGLVPIAVVAFIFGAQILAWIVEPVQAALRDMGQPKLQAVGPAETFMAYMKISVIASLLVGSPWVLYQGWRFIAPGLYKHERRFVYFLLPLSVVLTVVGVAFLYAVVMPILMKFFIGFGSGIAAPVIGQSPLPSGVGLGSLPVLAADPPLGSIKPGDAWVNTTLRSLRVCVAVGPGGEADVLSSPLQREAGIEQQYRVSDYVSLLLSMAVAFAGAFQAPVVVLLLGWVGVIDQAFLRTYRKHALFLCAVIAALATPGDLASMLLLWAPLYLLYELGGVLLRIFPAHRVAGRRPEPDDAREGP